MGNPNNVKGNASKLEALMNYQKPKKPRNQKSDLLEENESLLENTSCKLPDITENIQDIPPAMDQPTMQYFIDVIGESNILEDKELSLQLLFLINYFIQMKKNNG